MACPTHFLTNMPLRAESGTLLILPQRSAAPTRAHTSHPRAPPHLWCPPLCKATRSTTQRTSKPSI